MPEIARLSGHRDWVDLDFLELKRTPESAIALGIQAHLAGLSLSNTVELLDSLDVQRSRKAVHDWVQKADLQPDAGQSPKHVALDETVIRINYQQFWLYAAADPTQISCCMCDSFRRPQPHSPRCSFVNFKRNTMVLECGGSFTGEVTIRFLEHLQATFGEKLVVLLDQATYFTAEAVKDFAADEPIELVYFLTGSPDLNPTEEYWRRLKQVLGNRYFATPGMRSCFSYLFLRILNMAYKSMKLVTEEDLH